MPVHDWTRVLPGIFHHFHHAWIARLSDALNAGLLPGGYYALAEQFSGRPHPDVLALEMTEEDEDENRAPLQRAPHGGEGVSGIVAVAERPPQVKLTITAEESIYEQKANRIAIYHTSGDRVVAYIEIVSPGNKQTEGKLKVFLDKMIEAIEQGRHLLIIDLIPPRSHDPQGIHAAFWRYAYGPTEGVTDEKPLTLAAYEAIDVDDDICVPTGYFEPVAVRQVLPSMPLFLKPGKYIDVPLEQTYQAAWQGVPERWKRVIEASPGKSANGNHP